MRLNAEQPDNSDSRQPNDRCSAAR
eukprot:COSAG06_NODE_29899_length_548_cov_2.572383_1_plen_24_part_01